MFIEWTHLRCVMCTNLATDVHLNHNNNTLITNYIMKISYLLLLLLLFSQNKILFSVNHAKVSISKSTCVKRCVNIQMSNRKIYSISWILMFPTAINISSHSSLATTTTTKIFYFQCVPTGNRLKCSKIYFNLEIW